MHYPLKTFLIKTTVNRQRDLFRNSTNTDSVTQSTALPQKNRLPRLLARGREIHKFGSLQIRGKTTSHIDRKFKILCFFKHAWRCSCCDIYSLTILMMSLSPFRLSCLILGENREGKIPHACNVHVRTLIEHISLLLL